MASFLGLGVLLAFSSFNGVSPRVIQGNIESLGVIGYHNENIIKQGEIFKGKDSLTLSEYTQSLEKVVGRKSNSDDVDKAKKVKLVSQELQHFGVITIVITWFFWQIGGFSNIFVLSSTYDLKNFC